jgi:hypothetical protein
MEVKYKNSVHLLYVDGIAQFLTYNLLTWPLTTTVQEHNFNVKDKNIIFGHRSPTRVFVICTVTLSYMYVVYVYNTAGVNKFCGQGRPED